VSRTVACGLSLRLGDEGGRYVVAHLVAKCLDTDNQNLNLSGLEVSSLRSVYRICRRPVFEGLLAIKEDQLKSGLRSLLVSIKSFIVGQAFFPRV
jgi:hypothetical protein